MKFLFPVWRFPTDLCDTLQIPFRFPTDLCDTLQIPFRFPTDLCDTLQIPFRYSTDLCDTLQISNRYRVGYDEKKTQISNKNPPSVLLHLVKPLIMGLIRIGPKLSFCLAWALIPIKSQSPMALGFIPYIYSYLNRYPPSWKVVGITSVG